METRPRTSALVTLLTAGSAVIASLAAAAIVVVGVMADGAFASGSDGRQAFKVPQGRVENVRFERSPSGVVTVHYDLAADDPAAIFRVALEVSPPDGEPRLAKSVSGDVGSNIKPGAGKKIVWEANKDVESLQLDQFRFKVLAEGGPVKRVDERGTAPAAARTGSLVITSTPTGATVLVDGARRGQTPVTLKDVAAGKHKVQFTLAGYLENVQQVDLAAGQSQTVEATLTKGEAAAEKKGGSKMKWVLPLAGGAAAAAVLLASGGGGDDPPPPPPQPCSTAPAVQISSVTVNTTEVGLQSITEFTFTASGINGCRESGKTVNIAWTFGDGTSSSTANVNTTDTVTHTYTSTGLFTVTATVTDGRPASASASKSGIDVKSMTGTWKGTSAADGGVVRTLVLTQEGTSMRGTYQLGADPTTFQLSGTVSKPKTIDVIASSTKPTPTQFRGPIAADMMSFDGTAVQGTGHPGQVITFRRQ